METAAGRAPGEMPRAAFSAAPEVATTVVTTRADAADLEAREASFTAPFERVFATLKRMTSNYATLAVLDVRRAAVQLAWLVGGGIFITVLAVTAWLAVVVAIAVWLLGAMSWPGVLLVAALLNLVGAGLVALRLRAVFKHLPFEATLRQMKSDDNDDEKKTVAGATT